VSDEAAPRRRFGLCPRNDMLQCPGEHETQDRHDDAEMQKQIAHRDEIGCHEKGQQEIDDHEQNAEQRQKPFAMCEKIRCLVNKGGKPFHISSSSSGS